MMEDRIALEELYRWAKEGGSSRSVTMIGPDSEFGWKLVLEDGWIVHKDDGKDFAAVANGLLAKMKGEKK